MTAPIAAKMPPLTPERIGNMIIAPRPIPKPRARALAAWPPARLPTEPAPMEKSATQIPKIRPMNAYVTRPTLKAEPGPTRLRVAMRVLLQNLARMLAEVNNSTKLYLHCPDSVNFVRAP